MVSLGKVFLSTSNTDQPWRASNIATGEPEQRAPTTMASYMASSLPLQLKKPLTPVPADSSVVLEAGEDLSTRRQSFDIFGRQRFAAYTPMAARDVFDQDPGDRTHVLAFNRDHG